MMDRPWRPGPAFLLAQIGAHAAARFAERLAPVGLTPPDAGILRILASNPDISQRQLAEQLGVYPSRLVLLLDDLARRGLVERHPSRVDRRSHVLRLTDHGAEQLAAIARVAREHQSDLCASLSSDERDQLRDLLERIAAEQQLRPGVHPGYRKLNPKPAKSKRTQ